MSNIVPVSVPFRQIVREAVARRFRARIEAGRHVDAFIKRPERYERTGEYDVSFCEDQTFILKHVVAGDQLESLNVEEVEQVEDVGSLHGAFFCSPSLGQSSRTRVAASIR
jgi:hypothetical protein